MTPEREDLLVTYGRQDILDDQEELLNEEAQALSKDREEFEGQIVFGQDHNLRHFVDGSLDGLARYMRVACVVFDPGAIEQCKTWVRDRAIRHIRTLLPYEEVLSLGWFWYESGNEVGWVAIADLTEGILSALMLPVIEV